MGLPRRSAWAHAQRRHKRGMVAIDDKKTTHLPPRGRELAESGARRTRLSERFLNDVLGLGWAEAHEEAPHFEHRMTPVIEASIVKLLGNPTTCPHASPIPGTRAPLDPSWHPMDTFQAGDRWTVRFISD